MSNCRKKLEFEWEQINETPTSGTARAKVYGGWLVNICIEAKNPAMTTNFISDPQHLWVVVKNTPEVKVEEKAGSFT